MPDKTRLRPNPTIGIRDLMLPLKKHMERERNRDVSKWLLPNPLLKWTQTQAPNLHHLASISDLLIEYLKMTPNTVVSGKKHRDALTCLNNEMGEGQGVLKINFTSMTDRDFIDVVDEQVRISLNMVKTLAENEQIRSRAMKACLKIR